MTKNDLQAKHLEAMRAVANGADVWAYGTAVDLREVQRAAPELITIGRAMMAPTMEPSSNRTSAPFSPMWAASSSACPGSWLRLPDSPGSCPACKVSRTGKTG
ncbi:hypothetical protein [Achromobacter xylosoxidans]|uniref:hypothetical protein n=1 Tax=Alcaligenes xylosoxydans xylosoxydans TaxID=85698 RepID=UPI001EEA1A1B|nr:hypothetical protein [Achromobacter xylosoxidans]